jgi:hypothetical protein
MKIVILTLGTRGDVQPCIALGLGLQVAGYAVTLGTSRDFKSMVTEWGLGFAPFEFSVRETLASPDGRAALESKRAAVPVPEGVAPNAPAPGGRVGSGSGFRCGDPGGEGCGTGRRVDWRCAEAVIKEVRK